MSVDPAPTFIARPEELEVPFRTALAVQLQKQLEYIRKFGHGRPVTSFQHDGYRFVIVGKQLHYSKTWKTFPDFLTYYLPTVLGREWWMREKQKLCDEQHPAIQWHQAVLNFRSKNGNETREEIFIAEATAPVMAFNALAFDLYTLSQHALLSDIAIARILQKDQFQGARYEIYAAAGFIRAGFDITMQDEGDPSSTHCEFTATHRGTGEMFSVEAKSRHRPGYLGQTGHRALHSAIKADIGQLVCRALRKDAGHERIIFIDVNVPPEAAEVFKAKWLNRVVRQVERLEAQPSNNSLRSAFIVFTNHPYHYGQMDEPEPGYTIIFTAINNQDFQALPTEHMRQKYPVMHALVDSLVNHTTIPLLFE